MFRAINDLYNQAINICKDSNNSTMILLKLMKKTQFLAPYILDQVKCIFGLRGSSMSEYNHSSINSLVV